MKHTIFCLNCLKQGTLSMYTENPEHVYKGKKCHRCGAYPMTYMYERSALYRAKNDYRDKFTEKQIRLLEKIVDNVRKEGC